MNTYFIECYYYSKSVSEIKVVVGQLSLLVLDSYEKKYSAFSVIIEPNHFPQKNIKTDRRAGSTDRRVGLKV
jgi:hypothetical protein